MQATLTSLKSFPASYRLRSMPLLPPISLTAVKAIDQAEQAISQMIPKPLAIHKQLEQKVELSFAWTVVDEVPLDACFDELFHVLGGHFEVLVRVVASFDRVTWSNSHIPLIE